MNNLVLVMSLSGTFIVVISILLNPLLSHRFKASWRRTMLRMAVVFYLFPIAYFKCFLISLIVFLFKIDLSGTWKSAKAIDLEQNFFIFINNSIVQFSKNARIQTGYYMICITMSLGVIAYELWKVSDIKKKLLNCGRRISKEELEEIRQYQEHLKIKSKIRICITDCFDVPLTTGVRHSIILLPQFLQKYPDAWKMVLIHEMAHIKGKDVFWRILSIVVLILHWFNPFTYYLYFKLQDLDEACGDDAVVRDFDKEKRLEYCNVLLEVVNEKKKEKDFTVTSKFTGRVKKQIEWRIDEVMRQRQSNKLLAMFTGVIMFLCALGMTVFYQPTLIVHAEEQSVLSGEFDIEEFSFRGEDNLKRGLPEESVFVDMSGDTYRINENEAKVPCIHSFADGTVKRHSKKSDGGCITYYYNAQRCVICGRTEIGSLYDTETHVKCPH